MDRFGYIYMTQGSMCEFDSFKATSALAFVLQPNAQLVHEQVCWAADSSRTKRATLDQIIVEKIVRRLLW